MKIMESSMYQIVQISFQYVILVCFGPEKSINGNLFPHFRGMKCVMIFYLKVY